MARAFSGADSDVVSYALGTSLMSVSSASIVCWFKATSGGTANYFLLSHYADWNKNVSVALNSSGNLFAEWRTPTSGTLFTSASIWDDNAWHRLLYVRRDSSPYTQLYIDGASEGSSTNNPTTDATAPTGRYWGNSAETGTESFLGSLARCAYVTGTVLTPQQADHFLYTGRSPVPLTQWLEMGQGSPEPDWSGNVDNGTVTGATVADHAPVAPYFGAFGWAGAYTEPAAATGNVNLLQGKFGMKLAGKL